MTTLVAAVGTALCIEVPVLAFTGGGQEHLTRLENGTGYVYSYVNSIYDQRVEEHHMRNGDTLAITKVRSEDIRAVEYFGWIQPIVATDGAFEQAAPTNSQERLVIRVTPRYGQRFAGDGWTIDLGQTFGDELVAVAPQRRPLALALLGGWRP